MKNDFLGRAYHIPGVNSKIADGRLSHFQVQRFRELAPSADQTPCTILHDPLKEDVVNYANWAFSRNTNCTYSSGKQRSIQVFFFS